MPSAHRCRGGRYGRTVPSAEQAARRAHGHVAGVGRAQRAVACRSGAGGGPAELVGAVPPDRAVWRIRDVRAHGSRAVCSPLQRIPQRRHGRIVSLLPLFPTGGCFPTVVRIRSNRWLAWMSLGWPPKAIYRMVSDDGLHWRMYDSHQPEIRREAWPSPIKAIRPWFDRQRQILHGYVSVWVGTPPHGYYRQYHSTTQRF